MDSLRIVFVKQLLRLRRSKVHQMLVSTPLLF